MLNDQKSWINSQKRKTELHLLKCGVVSSVMLELCFCKWQLQHFSDVDPFSILYKQITVYLFGEVGGNG